MLSARRLALALLVSLSLVGAGVSPAAQAAPQSSQGYQNCGIDAVGLQTEPETYEEASYNEELTVCDWGDDWRERLGQQERFSMRNDSPVAWVFYDSEDTDLVPQSANLSVKSTGTGPGFRAYGIATELLNNGWIVSPGETVWLDRVDAVSFAVASSRINSSWLLFRWQSDKISSLGHSYAKRIFTGKKSKTRNFLWECVSAGVSAKNLLESDDSSPAIDVASDWLSTASSSESCAASFKKLFPKKSAKLPPSTLKVTKWFSPKSLNGARTFLATLEDSRTVLSIANQIFRVR